MDRVPRPGRWQRGLAGALAAVGAVLLLAALGGVLRITIGERAPGHTAGGAATLAERCSRGVPADLAQACIEAGQQKSAARRRPLQLAAALGGVLVILSLGVGTRARRPRRRRNGSCASA